MPRARTRVAHVTYAHIPVAKAGPVIMPHFSGTESVLPNSGWGTGGILADQ